MTQQDTYFQAVSDEKRKAQSKVVKMLLPGVRTREAVQLNGPLLDARDFVSG